MTDDGVFEQVDFRVRFGWGPNDTARLAPLSDLVVVVDVLRFTTAVTVAVERGAIVYPYRWRDDRALELAASVGAVLADGTDPTGPSLSPVSLRGLGAGDRLVLPSPNGATLTLAAAEHGSAIIAASLRNASAVGQSRRAATGVVSVIAAGERWPDGGLRPCFEDLVGAGAVLSRLPINDLSPEARAAVGAFEAARPDLADRLARCGSGRELIAKGYAADVAMAAELDASPVCPLLRDGAYGAG
jgi:2-phosphosulfolactate phosphatase